MKKRNSIFISALIAIAVFAAMPARAESERKPIKPDEITKQETIALGNNRFLIFSGMVEDQKQYGYTVDLVKIDDGIPHFDPLFMEDYDADNNAAKLTYGVAFTALSYHFDKKDGTLDFITADPDDKSRAQFKYKLDVDIFRLQEVITQSAPSCPKEPCKPPPPKLIFKASDNAQAH